VRHLPVQQDQLVQITKAALVETVRHLPYQGLLRLMPEAVVGGQQAQARLLLVARVAADLVAQLLQPLRLLMVQPVLVAAVAAE